MVRTGTPADGTPSGRALVTIDAALLELARQGHFAAMDAGA